MVTFKPPSLPSPLPLSYPSNVEANVNLVDKQGCKINQQQQPSCKHTDNQRAVENASVINWRDLRDNNLYRVTYPPPLSLLLLLGKEKQKQFFSM